MQFNFDGALQAVVRRENGGWIVMQAASSELPTPDDVAQFTNLEDNDLGAYLDFVLGELPDISADQAPIRAG